MKKNYLIVLIAILLLSAIAMTAVAAKDNGKEEKVRVIAHSQKEISDALSQGCKVVREARTLKALVCSRDVASSLRLQEDVKVFAMDTGANTQIRANLVQESGNTGAGRKVVILDTGYNYNHPELSSSYLGGKDFVNDDDDPMDDNWHGSHVAGIITGDGVYPYPQAKGVAPDTGIIAGKVLDASGSGSFSDIVAAVYWAVDNYNPDAISISLGTGAPYLYKGFCDNALPDMTTAIKYAVDKGVVVVVAAGNSGNSGVSIPGCISYSTTVGAVDSSDKIADFSGIGNAVDITAPGVNILSAYLGNSYAYAGGTSMATPVVSGTVALIKFAHPSYTIAQTQDALFKNAKDLGIAGKDSTYGWGRVDAYGASTITDDVAISSISAPSSVVQGATININVNVANQGTQPESFIVNVKDSTELVTIGSQGVFLNAGSSTILTFNWDTSGSLPGSHTISASASSVPGETNTANNVKTATVTVVLPDTTSPVISNVQVSSVTDTKSTITWATNEPADSLIRYGNTAPPSGTAYNPAPVTGHSITLTGLSQNTNYFFEVQSADGSGNTAVDNNAGNYYNFTTAVTPAATPNTIHVASITMSKVKTRYRTYATALVTIVNATGYPVSSATVSGHWSGLTSDKDTGITGTSGKITVRSNQVRNSATGIFTFTVDNVTHSTLVYNPADNVQTSNSISI